MNRKERRASAARARRLPVVRRTCGGCTECCTALGVPELEKGFHEKCRHEGDSGCGSYDERPQQCRNFSCQWLLGSMEDKDRPDKIGVIFDISSGGALGRIPVAIETRDGATESGEGEEVLRLVAKNSAVAVISRDGKQRLVGAPSWADGLRLDLIGDLPEQPS